MLVPVAVLPDKGASVVAFSPDSCRMAAGIFGTNLVKIWDLSSSQELLNFKPRIISYLAFSLDGSVLASAAQGWYAHSDSLILWDAETGDEMQRFTAVLGAISPDWRLARPTGAKV